MDRVFLKEDLAPVGAWGRLRSASVASLAGWLLLVIAAIVYFATLDTGLLPRELEGGDLITHQYAQVQARPGNAPGYPLYTMGGWLWFHGWRSLSALFGNATPNARFSNTRRSNETQNSWQLGLFCFRLQLLELEHSHVLKNSVFYLFQTIVILVQNFFRSF